MVALSTSKITNSEKAIYFLTFMPCSKNKVICYSHVEMVEKETGEGAKAPLRPLALYYEHIMNIMFQL